MLDYNRILVTGAAGYLGKLVRASLHGRVPRVRLTDIAPMQPADRGRGTWPCDLADAAGHGPRARGSRRGGPPGRQPQRGRLAADGGHQHRWHLQRVRGGPPRGHAARRVRQFAPRGRHVPGRAAHRRRRAAAARQPVRREQVLRREPGAATAGTSSALESVCLRIGSSPARAEGAARVRHLVERTGLRAPAAGIAAIRARSVARWPTASRATATCGGTTAKPTTWGSIAAGSSHAARGRRARPARPIRCRAASARCMGCFKVRSVCARSVEVPAARSGRPTRPLDAV